MAEDWFTAAQLADLALPELPSSQRQIKRRAEADGWRSRTRDARGGGTEYHVSSLPEAARLELGRRAAADAVIAPIPALPAPKAAVPVLPETIEAQLRQDYKLAILAVFDGFHAASGDSLTPARHKFVGFYNARQIDLPDWVRSACPTISMSSLERWARARAAGDAMALAGRYGNRKGAGVLDTAVADVKGYMVALMVENPHLAMHQVRRLLVQRFGDDVELFDGTTRPIPTERRLLDAWQDWKAKNRQLHLALTNPDDWKNKHRAAVGSYSEGIERPNQLWEIDASPSDVMLTDGRHSIYVVVDVYTRRIMILVTRVPRTSAVLLLIRRAVLAWGMPEAIKTDNGSDFTSREAERAYFLLGTAHPTCTPYSPEQKPHVERAIGTVQHGLMPLLPGYTGHNVATRQAIRSRETFAARMGESDADIFKAALTGDVLQQLADDWVANVYMHSPHEGLGDRTPYALAESCAGREARLTNERHLDLLLMPAPEGGTRTVSKKGIRVENADFWAPDLIPYIGTGDRFDVRLDPEDMGRVWVYHSEPFAFLCVAENPERAGLSRAALAAEAAELQKRFVQAGKAAIRAAKSRFRPHDLADALIGKPAATVTALPTAAPPPALPAPSPSGLQPSVGLVAAQRAITAVTPSAPRPRDANEQARTADIARRIAAPVPATEKPEDRWWRRAQDIEARIAADAEVGADELEWLQSIESSAWYCARKNDAARRAAFARVVE
ncbi:Mu transposase C-terminal domain-containing protein [Azospirillum picis]|uniref:Transposase n=1 Tax=Azospirillum picis TaxID=488438 RepID=A0ABU0MNQ4_9PROT|nr:Mu transposase C-terminal domain-containing protein [Azospirillum picis]MBP2301273.1 hypothetical protein [Azospirillum picis]MDQ0535104.1 hypothetical protein [Azospirillum picis]